MITETNSMELSRDFMKLDAELALNYRTITLNRLKLVKLLEKEISQTRTITNSASSRISHRIK